MSKRILQLFVVLLAVRRIILASLTLILAGENPLYAPHTIPDVPALDSNLRFLGAVGLGLGLVQLVIVPWIESRTELFRVVWLCTWLGGLARIWSIVVAGYPPVPVVISTAVEVIGIPILLYWQTVVAKSAAQRG